jgi:hypothetical protein
LQSHASVWTLIQAFAGNVFVALRALGFFVSTQRKNGMYMKKSKVIIGTITLITAQCMLISTTIAQELYRASVKTVCVSTNSSGGLSYTGFGNRQIIGQCAEEQGITNKMGLRLVYNRTADALEVVQGTNNTVICTPITFSGGVSLSKANQTVTERLAFVFLDNDKEADGTLRAREHFSFNSSNQITHFSLTGQLQFAQAAKGTNAAKIYSGSINAGSFFDHDHDEDDRD